MGAWGKTFYLTTDCQTIQLCKTKHMKIMVIVFLKGMVNLTNHQQKCYRTTASMEVIHKQKHR